MHKMCSDDLKYAVMKGGLCSYDRLSNGRNKKLAFRGVNDKKGDSKVGWINRKFVVKKVIQKFHAQNVQ